MEKILLILDLDETLIFGSERLPERPPDFVCGQFKIYKRPGLGDFVAAIRTSFDVAVWSSATGEYVRCVVEHVFGDGYPLRFVWSRERCTGRVDPRTGELLYLKDLKKVRRRGYRLARVLMVDDDARVLARSYGNLIKVTPYSGDRYDGELHALLPYLFSLADVDDVRTCEKRAWKDRVHGTDNG
jgi:RNA polymerase II subunit A small phosphatase-like protein